MLFDVIFFYLKRNEFIQGKKVQEVPKKNKLQGCQLWLRGFSLQTLKLELDSTSPFTAHQFQEPHLISSIILLKSHSFVSNITSLRQLHSTQTTQVQSPPSRLRNLPSRSKLEKCKKCGLILPGRAHEVPIQSDTLLHVWCAAMQWRKRCADDSWTSLQHQQSCPSSARSKCLRRLYGLETVSTPWVEI